MTEPTFIVASDRDAFVRLLATRSIEKLEQAVDLYETLLYPLKPTDGVREELELLRAELEARR